MGRPRARTSHALGAVLAAVCALSGSALLAARSASAETLSSTCEQLKSRIATANSHTNHGEGDVIVLTGLCEAVNLATSGGVTLPAGANFSIEGAPGTTSGFDGKGVTSTMLHSEGLGVGSVALRDLTFEHANVTTFAGGALSLAAEHLMLANDTFVENHLNGGIGGAAEVFIRPPSCPSTGGAPGLSVSGSVFRGNSVTSPGGGGAGGALRVAAECTYPGIVLEGDVFEGNSYELGGKGEAEGGALMFEGGSATLPTPVTQRSNVFDSNRVLSTNAESNLGGGGEWLEGASLTSVGDRFSRNSIPGSGPGKWSWGGGLGILNTTCNKSGAPTESTLQNAVLAGNSIGAGSGGELGGAGLYVGCSPSPTNPNHLQLLDATVTENASPPGGVAGIAGNPGDQLALTNSIVAGDVGGAEVGGFSGPGGSLSAMFSDVCAPGASAPLAGEGNICAPPRLADEGNPASFDVHETAASPTVDMGRNSLVPGGLTVDYYGGPRIVAGTVTTACGASLVGPATVDMGAAEAAAATVVHALMGECFPHLPTRPPLLSSFTFPSVVQGSKGLLTLVFGGPLKSGQLSAKATFKRVRTTFKRVHGHRRRVRKTETVPYGQVSLSVTATLGSPGVSGLRVLLKPTPKALKLLARAKRLKVLLAITYTQLGRLPAVQSQTITVRYKAPPRKHSRH